MRGVTQRGLDPIQSQVAAGENEIVEAYHPRLVTLRVEGYGAEQCWEDYRYGLFQGPLITVLGAFVAQPTARG